MTAGGQWTSVVLPDLGRPEITMIFEARSRRFACCRLSANRRESLRSAQGMALAWPRGSIDPTALVRRIGATIDRSAYYRWARKLQGRLSMVPWNEVPLATSGPMAISMLDSGMPAASPAPAPVRPRAMGPWAEASVGACRSRRQFLAQASPDARRILVCGSMRINRHCR